MSSPKTESSCELNCQGPLTDTEADNPAIQITDRRYIDPDFEALSKLFQKYFKRVQDCFVFINYRFDSGGITISDLKRCLVRLRIDRSPPFTCFSDTVHGYNFGRMWRRAGAQTQHHPLSWRQFDDAFRWHSHEHEDTSDIKVWFRNRASILEDVMKKVIDIDKRAQQAEKRDYDIKVKKVTSEREYLSVRVRALEHLKTNIAFLDNLMNTEQEWAPAATPVQAPLLTAGKSPREPVLEANFCLPGKEEKKERPEVLELQRQTSAAAVVQSHVRRILAQGLEFRDAFAVNDVERANIVAQGLAKARINTLEILDMPMAAGMAAEEDVADAAPLQNNLGMEEEREFPSVPTPPDLVEVYDVLCEARDHLALLGYVYTPPSFGLCCCTCQPVTISNGSSSSIDQIDAEPWTAKFEGQRAVIVCETQELKRVYDQISSSRDLWYRLGVEDDNEIRCTSTASLWKKRRQVLTLQEYPVREKMRHWAPQNCDSHFQAQQREHRRKLQLRISSHELDIEPLPSSSELKVQRSDVEFQVREEGIDDDSESVLQDSEFRNNGPKIDVRAQLNEERETRFKEAGVNLDLSNALAGSGDANQLDEAKSEREAIIKYLQSSRFKRVGSNMTGSLHGRGGKDASSLLCFLDARGSLTPYLPSNQAGSGKFSSIKRVNSTCSDLHHVGLTPIRTLFGSSNNSIYNNGFRFPGNRVWHSPLPVESVMFGTVPTPHPPHSAKPRGLQSIAVPNLQPQIILGSGKEKSSDSITLNGNDNVFREYVSGHMNVAAGEGLRLEGALRDGQLDLNEEILLESGSRNPSAIIEAKGVVKVPSNRSAPAKRRMEKKFLMKSTPQIEETTNIPDFSSVDFWPDYLRNDAKLMKERKLLESKLLGARRRVSLYVSPLALCFDMENGVVTTECEALGFGVSSHRKLKSPRKPTLSERAAIKERQVGEWVQAQLEIEREMQEFKPLEEMRRNLAGSGWKIVENEEVQQSEDAIKMNKAQILRNQSVRKFILDAESLKESHPTPGRGISFLKSHPYTVPTSKSIVDGEVSGPSFRDAKARSSTVFHDIYSPRPPETPKPPSRPHTARKSSSVRSRLSSASTRPSTAHRDSHGIAGSIQDTGDVRLANTLLQTMIDSLMDKQDVEDDFDDAEVLIQHNEARVKEKFFYPTHQSVRGNLEPLFLPAPPTNSAAPTLQPSSTSKAASPIGVMDNAKSPHSSEPESAHVSESLTHVINTSTQLGADQDLAARLYRLKKLAFVRTLRKKTDVLAEQALAKSRGSLCGKGNDLHGLYVQVQRLRDEVIATR
jgi:hypothetical protein